MKKNILCFVCWLIIISNSVFAAEKPKTIFIVSDKWDNITNEDNTGLIFDLVNLIFKNNMIIPKIKFVQYDESMNLVKHQKSDAAVGAYLNEQTGVIYPKYFYSQDDITVCFKKNKFAIINEKDLENKKVGFLKGYNYDKYINAKIKVTESEERKELVNLLKSDKIDFYVDTRIDINKTLDENKIARSDFEFVTIKMLNLYIVFADNENGRALSHIWDTEFRKALIANLLTPIYKKWKNATLIGMTK